MSRKGNTDTSYDVKEGHYLVGNRGIYKVWEFLGEGSFGKVAKCTKLGGHEFCAIKIMKRNEAGLREMESMKKIKHLDPEENHLIEMYECFTFQNVVCFVYELLAISLHEIVWGNPQLLSLETPAPDAAMTNVKDVKEVPSAGREEEPSVHSSINSAQCEKPVSLENIENTEGLQTDRDQEKMSSKIEEEDKSFVVKTGQSLEGHLGTYEVGELLGKGSYGRVFKCYKVGSEEIVAIKILENVKEGREEFKAMKLIKDLDPDQNNLMKFHECFSYNNATCLVYEILYVSLQMCLSKTHFHLFQIRAFAQQMFQALSALKSIGVVHGDIKPDNILLVKSKSLRIKLIDFGFAKKANKLLKGTEIQITPFRAPEVILGLPLDESIDMWAVGSVLACLYNRGYLFPCDTEYETIRAMVQIFGLPEEELLTAGNFTGDFFTRDDDGWRLPTADEYTQNTRKQVKDHVVDLDAIIQVHQDRFDDHDDDDHRVFIDLLKRMLEVNPQNRITPSQALAHDFITMKHLSGEGKAKYAAISEHVMGTVQFG